MQWSIYRKAPLLDDRTPLCGHNFYALPTSYLSHVAATPYVAKSAPQNGGPLGRGTTVYMILSFAKVL